jgi:hypothetical protein
MNYKELIKMVHPDLNPNIKDAGVKVTEIMKNKNDPSELMRLAIQWGLIKGEQKTQHTYRQKKSDNLWAKFDFAKHSTIFKSGMRARFKDNRGIHEVWFIKSYKSTVYFTNGSGIFTINRSLQDLDGKFEILRSRINDLYRWEIKYWKDELKKIRKSTPKNSSKVTFESLGIEPHKYYMGKFIVTYRGVEYELFRTNARCAFINYNGEEKRILLKSITKIRRK